MTVVSIAVVLIPGSSLLPFQLFNYGYKVIVLRDQTCTFTRVTQSNSPSFPMFLYHLNESKTEECVTS